MISDISVMIAGMAGDGVLFTGNVLARILKRQGWEMATYRDFPSNIRGEPTNYTIRASRRKIYGRSDEIDILLAFDCQAVLRHMKEMSEEGTLICDGEDTDRVFPSESRHRTFHKLPLRKLARNYFGDEIFKNMIALGALCHILELETSIVEEILSEAFSKKGRDVVRRNLQALNLGSEEARRIVKHEEKYPLSRRKDANRILISGDETIAAAALAAGCRFFAAYPICPASEISQWLAIYFPPYNGLVVQAEDELAAINMALGASYVGARAMTATSGPGASLMMEGLSLAGMAELPVVIADVQRVGPSTGMPTKSEQADLNQWVYGGHGDFPRVILSPGTIEECFAFTIRAFNLAEKYQIPVILLTEQAYGQNLYTVKSFDLSRIKIERGKWLSQEELLKRDDFRRYRFTSDGISPRVIPSMKGGIHMVESNEHDERGYRDEDTGNRIRMMEKRMRKIRSLAKDVIPPRIWGDREAEIGIVGFGSTFGPIQEARQKLREEGIQTKYLQIRTIWPFPSREVEVFSAGCREIFVVENNYSGHLYDILRSRVGSLPRTNGIRNYSSLAFRPKEIVAGVERAL